MKRWMGLTVFAFLGAAACNDASLVGMPPLRVETSHQVSEAAPAGKVDVLWVIDDSGSMGDEQSRLAASFEAFVERSTELNIDFRVAVISADPRSPTAGQFVGSPAVLTAQTPDLAQAFLERALLGTGGSSREAGLQTARLALEESMLSGPNAGFLRPDAILAMVFLSDEDEQSLPAGHPEPWDETLDDQAWRDDHLVPVQEFVGTFLAVKGGERQKLFAAAIIGDPVGDPYAGSDFEHTGCDVTPENNSRDSRGGFRYAIAVEAMGGFWRSICGGEEQFRTILEDIATGIALPDVLETEFATDYEPIDGSVTVTVDGVPVPEDPETGWQWVSGVGVVFSGAAVPPRCAKIEIRYRLPPGRTYEPHHPEPAPDCPS